MELCGVITMIGLKKGRKFSGVNKLTSHNAELHITFSLVASNGRLPGGYSHAAVIDRARYRL